jgi:LmbE family N-acetylglucosaminyl deacetylase
MCVVAHPDDECYGFGGALALATSRGVEVYVLCFTAGQAATNRGAARTSEELAQMRTAEFAASCRVLGAARHEVLDFHDGQMEFASFSQSAELIVQRIRSFQPHVMLTFGGDGSLNTHPDHTVISALATAAFHWSGRPKRFPAAGPIFQPERLFYQTTSYFLPGRQQPLPMPWTVALDVSGVLPTKMEAFRQHTSQLPVMAGVENLFRTVGNTEHYVLAAQRKPAPARQLHDLFEGLEPGAAD